MGGNSTRTSRRSKMSKETEKKGAVNTDVTEGKPAVEMTTITINNKEVEIPNIPEVIEEIQSMEHNLKSGYDKQLITERAKLNQEKKQNEDYLEEDIEWLNEHPDDWTDYAPKVKYGEEGGYKAIQSQTQRAPQVANKQQCFT